jgi:hypothetical protein
MNLAMVSRWRLSLRLFRGLSYTLHPQAGGGGGLGPGLRPQKNVLLTWRRGLLVLRFSGGPLLHGA